MIDIHFHCVPGIDDGPQNWDDAVALCSAAASQGTSVIVATPHVLRHPWLNENCSVRADLIARLNSLLGGTPVVLPGCEYFVGSDVLDLSLNTSNSPLIGLNGTHYLLIEFPATSLPRNVDSVIHELVIKGCVPVIAHPERNAVFANTPAVLTRLASLGALTQVTAGSILGDFGKNALKAANRFIDAGLVHVVASDAHDLQRRPPRLAAAFENLRVSYGESVAEALISKNPSAIVRGDPSDTLAVHLEMQP